MPARTRLVMTAAGLAAAAAFGWLFPAYAAILGGIILTCLAVSKAARLVIRLRHRRDPEATVSAASIKDACQPVHDELARAGHDLEWDISGVDGTAVTGTCRGCEGKVTLTWTAGAGWDASPGRRLAVPCPAAEAVAG